MRLQRCILATLQSKAYRPTLRFSSYLPLCFSSKRITRFAPQKSLIHTNSYGMWRSRALLSKSKLTAQTPLSTKSSPVSEMSRIAVIRSCFSISVIKIKLLSSQKGGLQSAQTLQDSQVIREDTKAPFAFITKKAPGKCSIDKKTPQDAFKPGRGWELHPVSCS